MNKERDALKTWLALLSASNKIKKSIDTDLRGDYGLSISRFDVLSSLERAGPDGLRAGSLSQSLMVTEGNTTQVTAPLIRDGLVRRDSSPDDRRVAIFKITPKGSRIFNQMAVEHRRWIAATFSGLSEPELKTFREIIAKLNVPDNSPGPRKDAA